MATRLLVFLACIFSVAADTPANCTYDDVVGSWTFHVGPAGHDNTLDCSKFTKANAVRKVQITLDFPDVATDSNGNIGFWTLIYNQGYETVINKYKWFAFSLYSQQGKKVTSLCHQTFPGWVHDEHDRDWACYVGEKNGAPIAKVNEELPLNHEGNKEHFKNNHAFIEALNSAQHLWTAKAYPELEKYTMEEIWHRSGQRKTIQSPGTAPVTEATRREATMLPHSWDWRNVSGRDWVSPIRDQGKCGSCYAFASCGMMEARWRIATNLTARPVFSPQDIMNCGNYSQACAGGFPYLVGGKYGQDFGLVEEACFPYKGKKGQCHTPRNKNCGPKYFTQSYNYIGGFYGGCNQYLMMAELVKNGPIAISIEVYPDLQHYKGGIYHHVTKKKMFDYLAKMNINEDTATNVMHPYNPWEITNHVVVIVGYGVGTAAEKFTPYWTIKNSWGAKWGEDGFFRMVRGIDNISCESIAVAAAPGQVIGPN
eukprot:TRINITY_DN63877_c0_g1_i1.p1 TRINITY_DN63877_c0_g1~~TRINITY_DN63877_c0_g1_i1.p1  ORF type:complete len:482 (+),score=55.64 TRINITY_DN63877_c0_g1_i1:30-1475(+)